MIGKISTALSANNFSPSMTDPCHYFGIRHHGPGCARSLLRALKKLEPDCLLVEGPAGCEALLEYLLDPEFEAPVALLSHAIEDPHLATFHPYAEFSPEWQAMRWAKKQGVPIQFIDLPPGVNLSWQKQDRATCTPHAQDAAEASEMESPDEVRIEVVDETAPVEGEENDGPAHDVAHRGRSRCLEDRVITSCVARSSPLGRNSRRRTFGLCKVG